MGLLAGFGHMLARLDGMVMGGLGMLVGRLVIARTVQLGGFFVAFGGQLQMLARLLMVLLHGLLGNRCGGVVLRGECHGNVRLRQVDRLFVGAIAARTWAS